MKFSVNAGHHRRTPCVLTPPSTPINPDLSAMSVSNSLPAHLYSQNGYRGSSSTDFTSEKVSPMHYSSNAYAGHQTTAVDIYNDLYNGYSSCGQSTEFSNELPAMEMPSAYNVTNTYGYESHKFNGEHSGYFDNEKKFDIGGVETGRMATCVQNGYMHYNNC